MPAQLVMPYAPEAQARARHQDPETSHEAARQHEASGVAAERRRAIRKALVAAGRPCTPAEIALLADLDYVEVHRRLSECDALNMATYVRDPEDPERIKGRKVRCPIRDSWTRLWFATEGGAS